MNPITPPTPDALRERDALKQFLSPDKPTLAGVKLRPFTSASLAMLREVDSAFITGIENCKNKEYEFLKFLYIQGHSDLDEVRQVVVDYIDDPKALKKAVLAFAESVTLSDLEQRMSDVFAIIEPAVASMVKVVGEKKKNGGLDKPEDVTLGKS